MRGVHVGACARAHAAWQHPRAAARYHCGMQRVLLASMIVFAVGCYTEGAVGVGYEADYGAPAPEMEVVTPGVQVVAVDYDYPVFFSDGAYWRYDGGVWYSSRAYSGGWAVAYNVPMG